MKTPSRPRWSPAPALRLSLALHAAGLAGFALHPAAWPWVAGALIGNHALLGAAGMVPRTRLLGPNLTRLPGAARARGEVALTFDDGPDPQGTSEILAILARHGAKASFFCVGRRALAHPETVRAIVGGGHSVENHSHTHATAFACKGPWGLAREVATAQGAIRAAAGTTPRFFRPPFGFRSPFLDPVLARQGLLQATWTRRGFDTAFGDPAALLRRLTRNLAAGDILLLHDAGSARTPSGEPVARAVLPPLLARIEASGLRAVSLPMALAP
ncbi:MAG: polysaccharide deacetylase family protein [Geminicoccaceae bacterium]|nr:polysaccharide deacetylase family protein [Geminicoccaceae bacterium]